MDKWLEPAIENRVEYVVSTYEKEFEEEYEKFLKIIINLKAQTNEGDRYLLVELEDLYIKQSMLACSFAYKFGLDDGMELMR
ncbi:hypothetical protein ABNB59_17380 [Paenibacillus larvae]|nr:hypothetical protein [Paenibacillus larvae]AQR77241.1 hypothetical protein BXP28_07575 [Paenibacillus larvae subsp. larvae]ETK27516.1 hypothetical protein ERIC1_1c09620 [Paenibacillus larvae subsp. larvae DSM 25719]AVF21791.1 hypothetical protein ERICI_01926 [Paenibacillus larvae subsp. larvae]MDT2181509.1 hypothetical protein [Paenibacillus larvae]MDT2197727.1 hypothetical protein [Paenibacillus larvae]